jgi:molecular chaperone GrpE
MEKFTDKFEKKEEQNNENIEQHADDNSIDLESEINTLKEENEKLKDSLIRSIADAENMQKRLTNEKNESIKYALVSPIKNLALLIDNFYLSVNNVKSEVVEKDEEFKAFFNAVNTNIEDLMKFLEKNNVRRINPMGEKFNPSEHEAVSQVQQDGVESGTVIQVLSGGYALSERVIKPAIVVVAA